MTFAELYGSELDHELGSSDTTELFTTLRRKAAINRAQREFARLTQCFVVELSIALSAATFYNLDSESGGLFVNFMARPFRLKRTVTATSATSQTRLTRRDEAWLDRERPGWRDRPASGTPDVWAFIVRGGANEIALDPAPNIPSTETWSLEAPLLLNPADMTADGDVPFTYAGDPQTAIEPYHPALAHFAASRLERLRKDREAEESQLAKFGAYVQDWKATRRVRGGDQRVLQVRDYLKRVRSPGGAAISQQDPFTWP